MKNRYLIFLLVLSLFLNLYFVGQKIYFRMEKNSRKVLTTKTTADLYKDIYSYCPNDSSEIIFLGNSITSGFMVEEFFPGLNVKNRGIWGDQTIDMLNRIEEVIEANPKKVFILAGINDIVRHVPLDETIQNMEEIILKIQQSSPETKIYIQSILPLTRHASDYFFDDPEQAQKMIGYANQKLKQMCNVRNVKYVAINESFMKEGALNEVYSWDGIHINGKGFLVWYKQINEFVVE